MDQVTAAIPKRCAGWAGRVGARRGRRGYVGPAGQRSVQGSELLYRELVKRGYGER